MIVNVDKCTTWTTTSIQKRKNKFKSKSYATHLGKENKNTNDIVPNRLQDTNAKTSSFRSLPTSPMGSTNDLSSRFSSQSCVNLIIHQRIVRQEDVYQDFNYSGESLNDPLNSTTNSIVNFSNNNQNSNTQIENSSEINKPLSTSSSTSHLDKNNNNKNKKFPIQSLNNPTEEKNNHQVKYIFCFYC